MSRSIRVAPEHKQRIKVALKRHGFPSQKALAQELGISRSTTDKFFTGKPIDYSYFVEITERLGLDWQAIASIEEELLIQVQPPSATNPSPAEKSPTEIDWRQICRTMREAQSQERLTTNPLTAGDGFAFELDEIYVPLGLVKRKQRDRRSGDVSPEQGSRVYEPEACDEITQTFEQDEFFEQVVRQGRSRRIAIIGEPGAGKTTLLQKIAAWVLDNTKDVPIWISLADLQRESIEQYLLQDWLKAATRKVRVTEEMQEALGELFNSGRVWLLLDAVDEMALETQSLAPLQLIANQLTGWVADAKVVLTCRLNVWDAGKNALEAFDTYRNLDFSYGDAQTPDQVELFIRRWFKSNPELAQRLRSQLEQPGRERIKDAVKNPLRLALLCRTWGLAQGGLPNTKAGLYQQFTEALYEWKQDRFPTTATQRQALNQALGELALLAIASEKTKFRLRHRLVCLVLGKPDEELFGLALQLGWLNQVGVAAEAENQGEKVYAFYHPTFQEYFAAQAIDDWSYFLHPIPHNPLEGTYRIFEPSWKEVILLWLGREDVSCERKEAFIKVLIRFEDVGKIFKALMMFKDVGKIFYSYRAYFLAAAGIAELRDCSWADVIVAQLIRWGFGYFDATKQGWQTFIYPDAEAARAALQETDRPRAIAALVKLLQSCQEHQICWQAFEDLGKIDPGNKDGVAALLQLIEFTDDENIRRQAVYTLGKMGTGNKDAIAALVQQLKSKPNECTRWQVAESLGKLDPGNQDAIAVLVQLIEPTQNELIRRRAFESLGELGTGSKEVIAALVQQLETSLNELTRWQVAESLGKLDPENESAIAALVQLIELTQDEFTYRQAVDSLGKLNPGNKDAISALMQQLESAPNEFTRCRAAFSLGKIDPGNKDAIAVLIQLLESTHDDFTCWQAADSLGKLDPGNESAIATLVHLMESTQDELTHKRVANSLGKIATGNETAIMALVRLIQSTKNHHILKQAVQSLKKIMQDKQGVKIIPALNAYLLDKTKVYNSEQFHEYYQLIWHCTKNLSYSDFYQAWYH